MSAEPVAAPSVVTPAAINRLVFDATCDFPPTISKQTGKPVYGTIRFKYQTVSAQGEPSGWTRDFTTANLTDEEVEALITLMVGAMMRHASEMGLAVDLTPKAEE